MPRRRSRARPRSRRRTHRRGRLRRIASRLRRIASRIGRIASRAWPSASQRRRLWRAFRRTPIAAQVGAGVAALAMLWVVANGIFQVIRKPTELFFPVSGTLHKTPSQTWAAYAPLFRRHSTEVISPELLAALAQVEGSGNPVVRTGWRWS